MGQLEIIQNALNWQKEGDNRTISIDVGTSVHSKNKFTVWCYDLNLMHGQFVEDGRPIDLNASHNAARKAEFEKLKAEFE